MLLKGLLKVFPYKQKHVIFFICFLIIPINLGRAGLIFFSIEFPVGAYWQPAAATGSYRQLRKWGSDRGSEPHIHTRRGPRWREFKTNSLKPLKENGVQKFRIEKSIKNNRCSKMSLYLKSPWEWLQLFVNPYIDINVLPNVLRLYVSTRTVRTKNSNLKPR